MPRDRLIGLMVALVIVAALFPAFVTAIDDNTGIQSVTNESVTADTGNYSDLDGFDIVAGSETVYNGSDAEMVAGTDYEIATDNGSIKPLSGGDISDGATIAVSYEYEQTSSVATTVADLIPLLLLISVLGIVGLFVRNRATGGGGI